MLKTGGEILKHRKVFNTREEVIPGDNIFPVDGFVVGAVEVVDGGIIIVGVEHPPGQLHKLSREKY